TPPTRPTGDAASTTAPSPQIATGAAAAAEEPRAPSAARPETISPTSTEQPGEPPDGLTLPEPTTVAATTDAPPLVPDSNGPGAAEPARGPAASGAPAAADVRRLWPEVLVRLREIKRTPWSLISQESAVVDVSEGVLTLAFRKPSLRDTFARRDDFQDNLRQAITDVLGVDLKVDAIVDPSADPADAPARRGEPARLRATRTTDPAAAPPVSAPRSTSRHPAVGPTGSSDDPETGSAAGPGQSNPDDDVHPDDPDHDDSGLSERQLLERTLGARVIEEIEHG
ncbi:MAG: hypothetical protein ACRDVN_12640, partial [Jiangellaceae bacterium]